MVVSMKAGHILPKLLSSNWVALDSGYTGMSFILSVDHQLGAPLHTTHSVIESEGVSAAWHASALQTRVPVTHLSQVQWSSHPPPSSH